MQTAPLSHNFTSNDCQPSLQLLLTYSSTHQLQGLLLHPSTPHEIYLAIHESTSTPIQAAHLHTINSNWLKWLFWQVINVQCSHISNANTSQPSLRLFLMIKLSQLASRSNKPNTFYILFYSSNSCIWLNEVSETRTSICKHYMAIDV